MLWNTAHEVIVMMKRIKRERPIPYDAYKDIDTDLARDNLENDIPYADLQDL